MSWKVKKGIIRSNKRLKKRKFSFIVTASLLGTPIKQNAPINVRYN